MLFKQRGQHWEGKEETEELSNKPKRAFLVLANSDTWGLSCQGLYITVVWLLKTPSIKQQATHPEKKLLYSHLMGSFQTITPQF